MVAVGSDLFFVADDREHGRELWFSDGTQAGTRLVADLNAGFGHGVMAGTLVAMGTSGFVAFAGYDGVEGMQLWVSNGAPGGTFQIGRLGSVASTSAGAGAAKIHSLLPVDDRLFFVADDGVFGEELWVFTLDGQNGAFAQNYGASLCPGTGGVTPEIRAFGLPQVGNGAFALDLVNGMPNSVAFVVAGFSPSLFAIDGCRILVGVPWIFLPAVLTNAAGGARTPLPIAADPTQIGTSWFGQYVVLDPNGPLFGDLSMSNGLWMRLGT